MLFFDFRGCILPTRLCSSPCPLAALNQGWWRTTIEGGNLRGKGIVPGAPRSTFADPRKPRTRHPARWWRFLRPIGFHVLSSGAAGVRRTWCRIDDQGLLDAPRLRRRRLRPIAQPAAEGGWRPASLRRSPHEPSIRVRVSAAWPAPGLGDFPGRQTSVQDVP